MRARLGLVGDQLRQAVVLRTAQATSAIHGDSGRPSIRAQCSPILLVSECM